MATLMNPRRNTEEGQAIIELALTLPLLLLIVFGIFDFGFMFQKYEVVTNAAREGARVGILPEYNATDAENRVIDYLFVGGVKGTRRPCGGLETANTYCVEATFGVTDISGSGTPPKTVNQVQVVVEYDHPHTFVGPFMSFFGSSLATVRLRGVSTMRVE